MTIEEFKKWVTERLESCDKEMERLNSESFKDLSSYLMFKTLRDEIAVIKSKVDEIEES